MKNSKKSMLLVLPWSPDLPGGVSVVVRNLAKVWGEAGVPALILVSDWASKKVSADEKGTARLRLEIFGKFSFLGLIKSAVFLVTVLWRTLALLRKQNVGTVCFHYANLDAFGVALLKRLKLFDGQLILCFHGTDVREPKSDIESALWKFVFSSANVITACSNSLARGVESTFGLPVGRVATVYNGVDMDLFSPAREKKGVPADFFGQHIQKYIVSVGSFIERKGHKSLLDAFAHVSSIFPDIGLIVIGMDGNQRSHLQAQVEALGLQDSVRFLVNLRPEQVAVVVGGATLCVQPSLAEPFGMAVIEAGASGVCVAASAVGGHLELISDQKTGFLFGTADVQKMGSALVDILGDDCRRAKVAQAFHAKVLSTFTWKACAGFYRQEFESASLLEDG